MSIVWNEWSPFIITTIIYACHVLFYAIFVALLFICHKVNPCKRIKWAEEVFSSHHFETSVPIRSPNLSKVKVCTLDCVVGVLDNCQMESRVPIPARLVIFIYEQIPFGKAWNQSFYELNEIKDNGSVNKDDSSFELVLKFVSLKWFLSLKSCNMN